jgi:hypothetical protein
MKHRAVWLFKLSESRAKRLSLAVGNKAKSRGRRDNKAALKLASDYRLAVCASPNNAITRKARAYIILIKKNSIYVQSLSRTQSKNRNEKQ